MSDTLKRFYTNQLAVYRRLLQVVKLPKKTSSLCISPPAASDKGAEIEMHRNPVANLIVEKERIPPAT
jgi:hypothetical protein